MTKSELRGLSVFGLTPVAIAYGAKRIETRSWQCPERAIGTQIAIHASKTRGPGGLKGLEDWMLEEQNQQWLVDAGYLEWKGSLDDDTPEIYDRDSLSPNGWVLHAKDLPRGVLVALATIDACVPTEQISSFISDLEWSHGDYTPGRWAWLLRDVERLTKPVEYSGALGLFKIEPWKDFSEPGEPKVHDPVARIRRQKRVPVEPWSDHQTNYGLDRSQTPRQFTRGVTA